MSKISVIVPVYNTEKYLPRCLDSLLKQTFTDFEVILIDDGSIDGSLAVCQSYAAKDSRFNVFQTQHRGQASARNAGIDHAMNNDSKYIAFIDSDDWVSELFLEGLYESVGTGVTISSALYLETDGTGEQPVPQKGKTTVVSAEEYYLAAGVLPFTAWGKLFEKSCFQSVRFPEIPMHEDTMLIYKILFQAGKIAVHGSLLYFYFLNNEGVSAKKWSKDRLLELDAMDAQLAFFENNGYLKALEHGAAIEGRMMAYQLSETESEFPCEKKQLKVRLRKHMKKYRLKRSDICLR